MTRFGDLVAAKGTGSPVDRLEPVAAEHIAALRAEFPEMPADYFDFLAQVGAGTLGAQSG